MDRYLLNIEYAVKRIFEAIYQETDVLMDLLCEEARLRERNLPNDLATVDTNIRETVARMSVHKQSVGILCGVLLQFAKQGISLVHETFHSCPDGRMIGMAEPLKNVIWQGRNHAIHYEESPNHSCAVKECFAHLEEEHGPQFSLSNHPCQNLSKEIVDLLGWSGYPTFQEDMLLLSKK